MPSVSGDVSVWSKETRRSQARGVDLTEAKRHSVCLGRVGWQIWMEMEFGEESWRPGPVRGDFVLIHGGF